MQAASDQLMILPRSLPAPAACLAAAGATTAWVLLHFVGRSARRGPVRAALVVARIGVGFAALLMSAQALQHWVSLATSWPLWPIALAAAAAVECLLGFYSAERRTVAPRRGLVLAGLRVALALAIALMLAQPVLVRAHESDLRRQVAVLLDRSASMQVADAQMSASERLRIAETLLPGVVTRPCRLEGVARGLGEPVKALTTQQEWLAMLAELAPAGRRKHLEARRQELRAAVDEARSSVARQSQALDASLAGPTELSADLRSAIEQARDSLARRAGEPLQAAADIIAEIRPDAAPEAPQDVEGRLRDRIATASEALRQASADIDGLSQRLDEALYTSLPAAQRDAVDAIAAQTRLDLACRVAFGRAGAGDTAGQDVPGLLSKLRDRYAVRAYGFASEAEEMDATGPPPEGVAQGAGGLQTDLAAALQKAVADAPTGQLAGVILLTDGRHNAAARLEPLAARLNMEHVPVCTVLMGGERPPTDAAIANLEAPETVLAGDKVYIAVDLKLDGLAGRTVNVALSKGDEVVQSQAIQVPTPEYRTRVELSDTPAQAALLAYRVQVGAFEDEALKANNEYPVTVRVSDDQVRVLLIESRPRWEYRYLKNLFASRDRTVRLQYVLFQPDRLAGQQPRPVIPASPARPAGEAEATALPQEDKDWLAFDVIILGDVAPADLPPPAQEAISRFVTERGGTLVVIAGRRFMPGAFAGSPLEQLVPVLFEPGAAASNADAGSGFHVALTPEGRDSVIMRLKADPQENATFWSSRPECLWRCPVSGVKPRAIVLAYARPSSASQEPGGAAAADADRQFQADHVLVAVQNTALGRVLFLAFDETWRLRYGEGDTYHHRFWGQLLRWATAGKLPAGTNLVKLGTDRARYPLHSAVQVRARLMRPDLTPVVTNEVAALLFQDERLVLRKRLEYIGDAPGMYGADLGELPSGIYRVELDGPPVDALLAQEAAGKVSTTFSVDPASSTELVELAADRGAPGLLAEATGGIIRGPAQATEVLAALGPARVRLEERHEYALWSSGPFLSLMVLLAASEWILRKKAGLP
jgi:hypothetical protein